jgi:hypothetical protein
MNHARLSPERNAGAKVFTFVFSKKRLEFFAPANHQPGKPCPALSAARRASALNLPVHTSWPGLCTAFAVPPGKVSHAPRCPIHPVKRFAGIARRDPAQQWRCGRGRVRHFGRGGERVGKRKDHACNGRDPPACTRQAGPGTAGSDGGRPFGNAGSRHATRLWRRANLPIPAGFPQNRCPGQPGGHPDRRGTRRRGAPGSSCPDAPPAHSDGGQGGWRHRQAGTIRRTPDRRRARTGAGRDRHCRRGPVGIAASGRYDRAHSAPGQWSRMARAASTATGRCNPGTGCSCRHAGDESRRHRAARRSPGHSGIAAAKSRRGVDSPHHAIRRAKFPRFAGA